MRLWNLFVFFGELLGPIEDYRTDVSVCFSSDPC